MKAPFLLAIFIILATIFSNVLSTLSLESGIFGSCLLLGVLCDGPSAFSPPGSMRCL